MEGVSASEIVKNLKLDMSKHSNIVKMKYEK